jgi:hypothetical protein
MRGGNRAIAFIGAALLPLEALAAAPPGEWNVEAEPPIAGEVRESIEEILSSPEYRRLLRKPKDDEKKADPEKGGIRRPPGSKDSSPGSDLGFSIGNSIGALLTGLLYVLAFGAIAFAVGWIVKSIIDRSWSRDRGEAAPAVEAEGEVVRPSELSSDAHLAQASALAAEGNHREAIRELLLGAMSWTERSRLLRFRRGLTNRDYLRALTAHPGPRMALAGLVDIFEEVFFGRRPATAGKYEECRNRYQEGFHGPPLAPTES